MDEVFYDNPKQDPFNFIQAVQDGSADFLEFVYLNPRKSADGDSNPYNLQIVPVNEINRSDYYTLGISGVTHFREGAAEFSPVCAAPTLEHKYSLCWWQLEVWQREFKLNAKIRRIPHFRKFRRWKQYHVWLRHVRYLHP